MKIIRVTRISQESLIQLRKLGYTVIIVGGEIL
jgi:hypothetical protein